MKTEPVDYPDQLCSIDKARKELIALRKLLNSSLDVICAFDVHGRFVTASAATRKLWGYTPAELRTIRDDFLATQPHALNE